MCEMYCLIVPVYHVRDESWNPINIRAVAKSKEVSISLYKVKLLPAKLLLLGQVVGIEAAKDEP